MRFNACETLVKAGDHDRWLSAQSAPPKSRNALMAIYAVNIELANAPWASPEPLVAQMRLRWWGDEIARIYRGERVTTHEILPALQEVIFEHNLPQNMFEHLVEARMGDAYAEPPESRVAFDNYIDATSGNVMALAARVLGAPDAAMQAVADFAYGAGVANMLRAVPALKARGRTPLPEPVAEIVDTALTRLQLARRKRAALPRHIAPALLAGWRADSTLQAAKTLPANIDAGILEESPARKMLTLKWRRITGRW